MMPAAPLSSIERLTKTCEYRRVYKEGKISKGRILRLYFMPGGGRKIKVGISIGRSVIKKAAARNRLKRIIREWFRQNASRIKGGSEVVVLAKAGAFSGGIDSKKIRKELLGLLGKAGAVG